MATTVDTLLVRIESDMSELRRDLKKIERQTQTSTKKVSSSFKAMSLAIKGTVGIILASQVARVGKSMVQMASDTEEGLSKASVVFGGHFDRVSKELEGFGNTVGRSTQELTIMASKVQDTFVPMGFARGEASDLSIQLSKLAVDVASFNNATDDETMMAFQSALVGNHETVRRFGVVITEATLKQELLRMGITKNIKEVTNAEKVQARLNLIVDGTKDAHNDATRTAGSYANQQKALSAALREFSDAVMTPLLPKLATFVGLMTKVTNLLALNFSGKKLTMNEQLKDLKERFASVTLALSAFHASGKTIDDALEGGLIHTMLLNAVELEAQIRKIQLEMFRLAEKQNPFVPQEKTNEPEKTNRKNHFFSSAVETQDIIKMAKQQTQILKEQAEETARLNKLRFDQNIIMNKNIEAHIRSNSVSDMEFQALQEEAMAELEFSQQRQEELKKELAIREQLTDVAIRGFDKMESAMLDFADGTTKGFDGIKDAMRMFVKDLQRTILKMTVFNAIKNAIFQNVAGYTPAPEASMGQIGSNIMGMFGKAGGGAMQRGRPYLVGERGAELFVPNTGGTLMNNMNTRNMGGGSTIVNQTINVETGVAPTVRAEIMNLLPSIKRDTISSLIEAKKRGGNIATAFA